MPKPALSGACDGIVDGIFGKSTALVDFDERELPRDQDIIEIESGQAFTNVLNGTSLSSLLENDAFAANALELTPHSFSPRPFSISHSPFKHVTSASSQNLMDDFTSSPTSDASSLHIATAIDLSSPLTSAKTSLVNDQNMHHTKQSVTNDKVGMKAAAAALASSVPLTAAPTSSSHDMSIHRIATLSPASEIPPPNAGAMWSLPVTNPQQKQQQERIVNSLAPSQLLAVADAYVQVCLQGDFQAGCSAWLRQNPTASDIDIRAVRALFNPSRWSHAMGIVTQITRIVKDWRMLQQHQQLQHDQHIQQHTSSAKEQMRKRARLSQYHAQQMSAAAAAVATVSSSSSSSSPSPSTAAAAVAAHQPSSFNLITGQQFLNCNTPLSSEPDVFNAVKRRRVQSRNNSFSSMTHQT